MMPYQGYQLYQAERLKNEAERRRADVELGLMAAAVSRLRADLTRPIRARRRYRGGHHLTVPRAESSPAAGLAGDRCLAAGRPRC